MNLALTPFHAIASEPDSCTGCMLDHEHISNCVIAFGLATMRGMPLCEMPGGRRFIYVVGQQGATPGECESLGAADQNNA